MSNTQGFTTAATGSNVDLFAENAASHSLSGIEAAAKKHIAENDGQISFKLAERLDNIFTAKITAALMDPKTSSAELEDIYGVINDLNDRNSDGPLSALQAPGGRLVNFRERWMVCCNFLDAAIDAKASQLAINSEITQKPEQRL